ncbi:hypothetical protein TgHK011_000783 [Trichoderma gracile]|nr:hypothetical protein TgHK011_000783 [Trichoderma gracile]
MGEETAVRRQMDSHVSPPLKNLACGDCLDIPRPAGAGCRALVCSRRPRNPVKASSVPKGLAVSLMRLYEYHCFARLQITSARYLVFTTPLSLDASITQPLKTVALNFKMQTLTRTYAQRTDAPHHPLAFGILPSPLKMAAQKKSLSQRPRMTIRLSWPVSFPRSSLPAQSNVVEGEGDFYRQTTWHWSQAIKGAGGDVVGGPARRVAPPACLVPPCL